MSRPTRRFQYYYVVKDAYGRNLYAAPLYETCERWCDDRPGGAGAYLMIVETFSIFDDPTTCRRGGLSPQIYWGWLLVASGPILWRFVWELTNNTTIVWRVCLRAHKNKTFLSIMPAWLYIYMQEATHKVYIGIHVFVNLNVHTYKSARWV